jgi:putative addiction module component (TIGR02574 family)
MGTKFAELERQAHALSDEERARLALSLIESLERPDEGDVDASWRAEVEARLAAYDRGEIKGIPGADVLAEVRRLLGR